MQNTRTARTPTARRNRAQPRYPATELLEHTITEADVEAVGAAHNGLKAGRCRATTSKGKPCGNTPQKGEQLCGPPFTQLVNRTTPATGLPSP